MAPSSHPSPSGAFFLDQLLRRRRAIPHFQADPVPAAVIEAALRLAAEAPSGYNLQPWRYILIREHDARARLRAAAFNQPKITEAPLMIVACAERDAWQGHMEEIFATRAQRTGQAAGNPADQKRSALAFIDLLPRDVWLTRQVMIGFTYLMLAFESLGWNTAPMEGFTASAVRTAVGLPDDAVVVALLAVGRAAEPLPSHPGRLSVASLAFAEKFGQPFTPASP